jgi:glycosyltransferase involved in cell wall biosynthesis
VIIKNALGVPVYVPEWDARIPAGDGGQAIELSADQVRSAPSLKSAVAKGYIVVAKHDSSSGIEEMLAKLSAKASKPASTFMLDDVVVRGQMLDYSGYAKVNRGLVRVLRRDDISVSADPVDLGRPCLLAEDVKNDVPLRPRSIGVVDINSVVPTYGSPGGGNLRILYTTCESETLPQQVVSASKRYDRVWCVSKFCADVMREHGVMADVLYPHIDKSIYTSCGATHQFSSTLPSFKFFTIFGMSPRKVGLNIVKAFLSEFDPSDDVVLILAHRDKRGGDASKSFADLVGECVSSCGKKKPPLVVRMPKPLSESGLAALYRSVDACVLASRGEGFCLPYAEAAMCGIPSVAPKFGGQLDFLNDDSAYLVDVDKHVVPKGAMNTVIWDDTVMADVTSSDFITRLGSAMRRCRESRPETRKKMAKLVSDRLAEMCDSSSVLRQFKELISK